MKQLTKNLLKMNFRGVEWASIQKIEFAFSQELGAIPLKEVEYPGDGTLLVSEGTVGIEWTAEDTRKFVAGKPFFADTRISLMNSEYQPETSIVKLIMNPTLFRE